ncbi:LINE-1 reverse transcriptase-like [Vitis vinifera]|uniref:LINE-1 reverse transcriptase-like n=1 Tax=Vitis vinifera TaxID=29760 RepID=A0A438FMM6_VITVI|nr:LINE-1 reverse transcriptase-like [Vitis vinifera]
MKLRLLSWNVRGANDSSKRRVIKAVIRSQRVDLFCLQETKIQSLLEGLVRSLGSGRWSNWVPWMSWLCRRDGGVLNKRSLEVMETEVGKFSVSYRECLWEELGAIRGLWEDPWCLGGDFNVILSQRERSRQGRLTGAMRIFAQTVDELELLDLPMQGGAFTWSGGLLRGWWQGIEVRGRASFRLASKLKFLKQKIEVWNRELKLSRKGAKDAFHKWVLLEEVHWRQKSRELWLKEGDRNTGYFHRMANAHRRNNSLDRIMINGEWLTKDQEVREGIVNAFQNLLSEEPEWRADIEGLHLNQLNLREAEDLERPFSEEEIHGALMEMRGDKAPGPDGFTMAFWQECWEFVKEEVVDLFKEFFEHGSFSKCLNTTFLVLIPKKGGVEDLGDFKPISLLGGLYKLLAKVLANRLKKVLDRVVSVDQNAFVRGRQILDASLVANEVIDYWHKRKEKGLICKLDIEKAYDSINWKFLMKGLWQGDPLSPYLFVLGMEVLSTLLRRAGEGGFLSGCRLRGRGGVELIVSHLLFADDTIIFCKAKREQVTNLSWVLAWFEAASGLRINLAKSALIPVGQVDELEELAAELGCRLGVLPTVYLGLPLGAHHKTSSSWDGVEERMRRRLAQWKRQYISKGGRITLIKSTLASIPIYFLSLIRIPKSVTKRIEKIQRDFLWGEEVWRGKLT